jgi:hypothetical protein
MFKHQNPRAQRGPHPLGLALEKPGPLGIVVNNLNQPHQRRKLPNMGSPYLLLRQG